MSAVNNALSGLNSASVRLDNSANNIANMQSTSRIVNGKREASPYMVQDVVDISIEPTGGVETRLQARDSTSIPVYEPDSVDADAQGYVQYPDVNLDAELANLPMLTYGFKANLKVLEAADNNSEKLLDILA